MVAPAESAESQASIGSGNDASLPQPCHLGREEPEVGPQNGFGVLAEPPAGEADAPRCGGHPEQHVLHPHLAEIVIDYGREDVPIPDLWVGHQSGDVVHRCDGGVGAFERLENDLSTVGPHPAAT